MSIQSDVEMLSIRVLEDYARLHHLPENDAVDLFHKYQVFEKLILQHEYLHQLDYSETVKYVEEAVERLRYNKVNNQVSFHTPLALKRLQFECRKEVTHA